MACRKLSAWYQNEEFQLYQQPVTTTVFNFKAAETSDREAIAKEIRSELLAADAQASVESKDLLKLRQNLYRRLFLLRFDFWCDLYFSCCIDHLL